MFSLQRFDKPIYLVFWIFFVCPFHLVAQSFQNGSLESWGPTTTCGVNTVPDGWLSFSNGGQNLDECDFSICASTIPAQASEGNSYGRAYAATLTTGEGIAQQVDGFIVGNEYEVSFDFAGSNLLPGSDNCRWHIFLDNVEVDATIVFSAAEAQWSTHTFTFIANSTSHVLGFRAFNATQGSGGSAGIDNFVITNITPEEIVPPIASFTQSQQIICVGECIVFTNTSQFETQANWTFESGSPSTSTSLNSVTVCYDVPGVYSVELSVSNDDGTDQVVVQQAVTVNALPEGTLSLVGDSLLLTTDLGIGNIDWTLNDAPISESGYLIYPVEFGLYGVNLQISPSCNTVLEVVTGTIPVWIPNAVTFGEDGVNDSWGVYGELSALESFEVQVFNRWGQKVFETNDIEQRWTGSAFDGAYFVPDGIYLYIVTLKFPWEIENRQYEGHITVLR
jgi:gliding motility-associated-like protein